MRLSRARFVRRFFIFFGYAVFSIILAGVLLELSAFGIISANHWIHPYHRDNFASISPAYAGYPWASEYWKEESSRWMRQGGDYQPFRVWGVPAWHSKYINTDDTPKGTWRRTINPISPDCENQTSIDVWMFGGSTVYGTGVPDWATLPSFLSRDLNAAGLGCVVVTNFGAEAYVTNQEVILLMEQLKSGRRPAIVIFYDGVNDSYVGTVSPGVPTAHVALSTFKARFEGSLAGRIDFLRNSYTLQLARSAVNFLHRPSAARPREAETESKAMATLDNYEANIHIAKLLGEDYGFRVFCFWQPSFVYGRKPLHPFEMRITGKEGAKNTFLSMTAVYQHAEHRAATDRTFVFLGDIFDSVKEPFYIDKWMHLTPQGNEFVAQSVANVVEGSLRLEQIIGVSEEAARPIADGPAK